MDPQLQKTVNWGRLLVCNSWKGIQPLVLIDNDTGAQEEQVLVHTLHERGLLTPTAVLLSLNHTFQ